MLDLAIWFTRYWTYVNLFRPVWETHPNSPRIDPKYSFLATDSIEKRKNQFITFCAKNPGIMIYKKII